VPSASRVGPTWVVVFLVVRPTHVSHLDPRRRIAAVGVGERPFGLDLSTVCAQSLGPGCASERESSRRPQGAMHVAPSTPPRSSAVDDVLRHVSFHDYEVCDRIGTAFASIALLSLTVSPPPSATARCRDSPTPDRRRLRYLRAARTPRPSPVPQAMVDDDRSLAVRLASERDVEGVASSGSAALPVS